MSHPGARGASSTAGRDAPTSRGPASATRELFFACFKRGRYGDGTFYPRGRTWWIKYRAGGRWHYETSGSPDKPAAQTVLDTRRGQCASGAPVEPRLDRVTYAEAAAALRTHCEMTGSRDLAGAELRLAHLDGVFSGCRLVAITTAAGETYAGKRQGEGAANGTINRELAVLGRMLRLAHEHDRLARAAVALLNGDKDGDNRPVRLETRRASG